jgi:hypothetical protein
MIINYTIKKENYTIRKVENEAPRPRRISDIIIERVY